MVDFRLIISNNKAMALGRKMQILKTVVVVLIILTFIFSYSIFFIDFSSFQRPAAPAPRPDFQGPSESPPAAGEFQEPVGLPKSEMPTAGPPPAN